MIRAGDTPDTFLIDFSKAKRRKRAGLGGALESIFVKAPAPVTVDGHALGQAICAVMDACEFADVQGRPWLWNDYACFLSRADHDRLRHVEDSLRGDLLALLHEEMVRRDARMPDAFVVRLLVDEAEEIAVGSGVIRVRHQKDVAATVEAPGEITMRADKPKKAAAPAADHTDRDTGLRVRAAAGAVAIPEGRRVTLGRASPDSGADHVALPGAGPRVNRAHVQLKVVGNEAEFLRISGANPVEVSGRALGEGEGVTVPLPAELVLGAGAWRGTVCR